MSEAGGYKGYIELPSGGGIGYGGPVQGEASSSGPETSLFEELQKDPSMCHRSGYVCANAALFAKLTGRHFTQIECEAAKPGQFDGYTVICGLAAKTIEAWAQLPPTADV